MLDYFVQQDCNLTQIGGLLDSKVSQNIGLSLGLGLGFGLRLSLDLGLGLGFAIVVGFSLGQIVILVLR